MWVPVQRSAEDMFVDMGTDVAAAAVDQVVKAVQVQSSSAIFQHKHSPYFAFKKIPINLIYHPVVSTNLVTV